MEGIGTMAAAGGFLLAAVLIWAVIANSRRTKREVARTEKATHDLYQEIDREDQATDPDKNNF